MKDNPIQLGAGLGLGASEADQLREPIKKLSHLRTEEFGKFPEVPGRF